MRRQARADRVGEILDDLYPEPGIPLGHRDPFTLLVAVMLSAQATDKKVNEVTPDLFALADTAYAMAGLGEMAIRKVIKPIGLAPTKARNIAAMSAILVERHGGEVPADIDALEALPGVGHKTASVVMVQAFGLPAFPIDTHIFRCARRWSLSRGKNVVQVERDLKKLWPPEDWGKRHLQIIYFGREYCPARGHEADACPICAWADPDGRRG